MLNVGMDMVNEIHCGDVQEPTDFEKSRSLEVEGETSVGKRKLEVTPEVEFLNVRFISEAITYEIMLDYILEYVIRCCYSVSLFG
ncbi:hypothetical protein V6N12_013645 [Hibiscus sabdariffa]|uniref:Uncharacterized protein n=1 Tax=Hibiscus sabdariffa TaxID=183260 RepID=A0ABR2CBQ0_9ROSI